MFEHFFHLILPIFVGQTPNIVWYVLKLIVPYSGLNSGIKQNADQLLFSGLLITGGTEDDTQHIAEVWIPGDQRCLLPRLPSPGRRQHSQSSLTACGGSSGSTQGSCHTFTAGEWEQSHTLAGYTSDGKTYLARWLHVSWQSPKGILLLGGKSYSTPIPGNGKTTELLSTTDKTTTASFTLEYETM